MRPETHLKPDAASGIAASGASFHDFWCYLRFSLEKPPAGSQAASGKGVSKCSYFVG